MLQLRMCAKIIVMASTMTSELAVNSKHDFYNVK